MSIKSKVYLDNLVKYLGLNSVDDISNEHTEKILDYMQINPDINVLKEIFMSLPDYISFAKDANEKMHKQLNEIIKWGIKDTDALKEIIIQLNKTLENEHLIDKDKDRIFDLITKFSDLLEELVRKNVDLRELLAKGIISCTFLTICLGALIVYKAVGGKGGDELVEEAAKKFI